MEDVWTRVFGLFIAAMGAWMINIGRKSKATASSAKLWPTAEAVITKSEVKKRPGANARFRFKVKYRYEVNGQSYSNDKLSIGGETRSGRTRAASQQAKYPKGSTQRVSYNPDNPEESFLEPSVEGGGSLETLGGAAGVIVGLLLLFGIIG